MISSLLALALAAAAFQADPVNDARRAFSTCLRTFANASLERRMEPPAFETALGTQCSGHAATYRTALVQRDARVGGGRARAEEDARIMIEDSRANVLEFYRDSFQAAAPRPAATAG